MKNKDVIAMLQKFPLDMDVAILDYQKNGESDMGYGSLIGIYENFEIGKVPSSKDIDGNRRKAWVAISFQNEDYDENKPRTCRVCGCTEENCRQCIEKTGAPCHWVEEDLCSACVTEKAANKTKTKSNEKPERKGRRAGIEIQQ